uniref:Uncharacterized protein n=1 Tax=Oryza punctata TaxID=4537 RepID=A0A0E0JIL2_ORYPU
MNGNCNLTSSPPVASGTVEAKTKWEGVAVGRRRPWRGAGRRPVGNGGGGGLQAVVRRAFSKRRNPSSFTDGYWRIHADMDGDDAAGEHQEQAAFEEGK